MGMYKPRPLVGADFKMDSFYGAPIETLYSRDASYRSDYQSVQHLLKNGQLIQVFGDYEASDKDNKTAEPKEFGALAFDLQGLSLIHISEPTRPY